MTSDDLLPERALSGDGHARRQLVREIYTPLSSTGSSMLETVSAFLDHGGSIEGTARSMFVHANTVRYRLRRAAEVTGLAATDPRHAYTYRSHSRSGGSPRRMLSQPPHFVAFLQS